MDAAAAAIFILSTYLLVSVNPLGQKEEKIK